MGHPIRPKPQLNYQLPTKSESQWSVVAARKGNDGLVEAIRSAANVGYFNYTMWVGTLGANIDRLEYSDRTAIELKLEDDYEALVVLVCDQDFEGHYKHFCKAILWPIFHYQVPDNPRSKAYEDCSWGYYVTVNQAFAERIAQKLEKG